VTEIVGQDGEARRGWAVVRMHALGIAEKRIRCPSSPLPSLASLLVEPSQVTPLYSMSIYGNNCLITSILLP